MRWTDSTARGRTRLLLIIKLLVTVGIIGYLLARADWAMVAQAISRVPAATFLAAFAILLLGVAISTYKWRYLLELHGIEYPFRALHRYYFIAFFFNNFLPTGIGGDGYRIYKTLNNDRSRASAAIAVIMERVTGIVALLVIGYGSAFLVSRERGDPLSGALIAFGSAGIAVMVALLLVFLIAGHYRWLPNRIRKPRLMQVLLEHGCDYLRQPRLSIWVMLVSFFFQVHNSMLFFVLLKWGVHATISLPELFVVLTLVNLFSMLPISINGLGVVDGAFIHFAGQYEVGYDAALAVMLIARALLIGISLIGAAFFLGERGVFPNEKKLGELDPLLAANTDCHHRGQKDNAP
jgi:uncharacterized membrane protein YbhN (UPF0104 family)